MKKKYFLMLLLLSCSVFSFGQELLVNGNFESWDDTSTPTGWTKAENSEQESTVINRGTYALKHTGGRSDISQTISGIISGNSYTISVWYKVDANFGDGTDGRIWSYWKDVDGNNVTDVATDGFLRGPDNGYFDNNGNVWTQYTTTVVAPAGATQFYFELRTYGTAVVYYDDLSFFSEDASTEPSILLGGSIDSLDYYEGSGPSDEATFTVSGSNLTDNIIVTAPTNFEISTTSGTDFVSSLTLTASEGTVDITNIYIRLSSGLVVNTYADDVIISSTGVDNKTLAVSGVVNALDPQLTVSSFLDSFNYTFNEGPSNEDSFTVSGLFLTSDVVITATTNFEISLTSDSGFGSSLTLSPNSGTVESTVIYVRLQSGLAVNNYAGSITIDVVDVSTDDIVLNGNVYGEATNSLIITGIFDATLTGGTPKGIELYVINDINDLSLFGISSVANGGGSSDGNIEYNFPADAVSAGTYIYLSTESENFNAFFGFDATYTDNVVGINGDDSIELYENSQIIDTFGDVNEDGTGLDWEYLDGWAYRSNGATPQGTTFTSTNWTYSLPNAFDNFTTNAATTTPFPIGTYATSTASTIDNNIVGFSSYPNPVTNNIFTLSSASVNEKQVRVFNLLGKEVLSEKVSGLNNIINVATIATGIYILKVSEGSKTASQKLVIK